MPPGLPRDPDRQKKMKRSRSSARFGVSNSFEEYVFFLEISVSSKKQKDVFQHVFGLSKGKLSKWMVFELEFLCELQGLKKAMFTSFQIWLQR